MALTDKAQTGHLTIVDDMRMPDIKTKSFVRVMNNFAANKTLIVTEAKNENLEKSSKNVPWVKVMRYEGLNVYDILKSDDLFLERSAVAKLEEAFGS